MALLLATAEFFDCINMSSAKDVSLILPAQNMSTICSFVLNYTPLNSRSLAIIDSLMIWRKRFPSPLLHGA